MTALNQTTAFAKLREQFPAANIAKLPKVSCWNCTQAAKNNKGATCNEHRKAKCAECGNFITTDHIHLDYVGHAETTARLLDADPEWTWEPLAFDDRGLPAVDGFGGLWIRLTIAGVTRLGYGSADGKPGPNGVKEAIGDAIRNAAMRFGVALDLWAKTDLHSDDHDSGPEPDTAPERPARRESGKSDDEWTAKPSQIRNADKGQITNLVMEFERVGIKDRDERLRLAVEHVGHPLATFNDLTAAECADLKKRVRGGWPHINPAVPSPAAVETGEVYAVVAQLIAEAPGLEDLGHAGEDIAKERDRGNLTPGEIALLKDQWSKRKRELDGAMVGASA